MLPFMDFVQHAFYNASAWNIDNSYSSLTATSQSLLSFPIPRGLNLHLSSLSTPHLASSYTVGITGPVSGSLSYLFSSLPLSLDSRSGSASLSSLVPGYRHIPSPLALPGGPRLLGDSSRRRHGGQHTLLYARMFLPVGRMEGLLLRRSRPERLLRVLGVSDRALPNGGSLLGVVHTDRGKHSLEWLFSTDSALLGVRGLYNFGWQARREDEPPDGVAAASNSPPSLFSAGGEVYYGIMNKSFGLSTGVRFTTLPTHSSFPYTMTLTLNPLMGNLSSTYAVKAGKWLSLASQFDFNFYSYESGVLVGCELWKLKDRSMSKAVRSSSSKPTDDAEPPMNLATKNQGKVEHSLPSPSLSPWKSFPHGFSNSAPGEENVVGVLKARVDQDLKFGLLWESRLKELLISVGASIDLKRRERVFGALGLEVQYST